MQAWIWWVLIAVGLAIIEMLSLDLIFIMIAAGALAAALAAGLGAPLIAQVLVAAAVSLLMLVAIRPIALRHLRGAKTLTTNIRALEGRDALVLERVDDHDGRIKLRGEIWTARSEQAGVTFDPGTTVRVDRIDGAIALVRRTEP